MPERRPFCFCGAGSAAKLEDNGNMRFDFDGLVVEQRGTVAPLGDSGKRRLSQDGAAADQLELADETVSADDGAETDGSLKAAVQGNKRVDGLDTVDELRQMDSNADAAWLVRRRRGGGRRPRIATRIGSVGGVVATNDAGRATARRQTGNLRGALC